MTRELLFDKLLKHLYDNADSYWQIDGLADQHFGVTDRQLLESIVDEMLEKNWATSKNYSKWSVIITFDGRQIIDKYNTYSSFLKSLDKVQTKSNREKNIKRILSFIGTGGVLWGATFTYLNYDKSELMKQKDNTIQEQQARTNSLNQLVSRQQKTIDSLQTILRGSDTINKNDRK